MIAQTQETVVTPNGKKVTFFPTTSPAWYVGGNTNGYIGSLGNIDDFDLSFITNNKVRMTLTKEGLLGINTTTPATALNIVNDNLGDNYDDISLVTYNGFGSTEAAPNLFLSRSLNVGGGGELWELAIGDLIGGVAFRGFNGSNFDKAYSGMRSYYTGPSRNDLRFYTSNKEAVRIADNGNVGIGSINPTAKLEVNNGSTAGAVKIVDGTQGLGKVLTSDANGLATWKDQAVTIIEGTRPSTSIDFSAGNTENAIGGSINLPVGNWLINIGLLVRAKIGESVKPNTCYTGRFTLSSSKTQNVQTGFSFVGSNLILQTASTGVKVPPNYPLFASGVIRVNVTSPVTLYIWNAASSHTVYGCGEIGSIGNNGENYIYATKTQ
ncbi:hypothetical protein SAMN06265349_1064 [Flavobacterium resistens]|nr:hypothetical protein SAMN06265349_1064 [Flavobacterium resistens]